MKYIFKIFPFIEPTLTDQLMNSQCCFCKHKCSFSSLSVLQNYFTSVVSVLCLNYFPFFACCCCLTLIPLMVLLRSVQTPGEILLWYQPTACPEEEVTSCFIPPAHPCAFVASHVTLFSSAKIPPELWQSAVHDGTQTRSFFLRGARRV